MGAVICEPVSDAHSLFSGKIQGSLPILVQEVGLVAAFPHVDQWVGSHFPKHRNREFFWDSREQFWPDEGARPPFLAGCEVPPDDDSPSATLHPFSKVEVLRRLYEPATRSGHVGKGSFESVDFPPIVRHQSFTSPGVRFDVVEQQKAPANKLLSLEMAMANKDDFTPEEWTKLLDSILAAGLAVSATDPSGWWGTLKEAAAATPALAEAQRHPNSNELIKATVADFARSSDGSISAMRERFARAEPVECVQRSLESLREASAIVDAKAPDEAIAFKTWLRKISQQVAEASVEGSFLGFGGVRVSDAEKATLGDISKALGI